MRELKFRAWDSVRKVYFTAEEMGRDELSLLPDGRGFANVSSLSPKLTQILTHLIPEQYTGFKDSEGKEIYEGDKVEMQEGYGAINGVVEFEEGCFIIGKIYNDDEQGHDALLLLCENITDRKIKVWGNIHEQKEKK